nr:uncharacterized protein LOC111422069 [Onthophagus taurus]
MLLFISLTISTTEFVLQKDIVSFSLIALAFLSLFIVHTIGQKCTTVAGTVAEGIYDLNWYDADISTRRDILNLLCLTQKVIVLKLPLFGELSHASAAKEYKAVYVFYNWVLTIMKKKYI